MNLDYLPRATEGHMTPSPEVLNLWKDVMEKTQFTHLFEIGTNAGHSAAIVLTLFPEVRVTSMDIGSHGYTSVAVKALKEKFGDRFSYIEVDSTQYFESIKAGSSKFPDGVDIINIDGNHEVAGASSDIQLAKHVGVEWIMIDDFSMYGVPAAWDRNKDGLIVVETYDYKYDRNHVKMALVKHETNESLHP